jgi:phosphatidylethanolamine-binding protein (PEBP) family uncharacterized protein
MTIDRWWLKLGMCIVLAAIPPCSNGKEDAMSLTLSSPAFSHQSEIPDRYTCDGDEVSPALRWSGVPSGAESLALVVDDPDAPDPASPQ